MEEYSEKEKLDQPCVFSPTEEAKYIHVGAGRSQHHGIDSILGRLHRSSPSPTFHETTSKDETSITRGSTHSPSIYLVNGRSPIGFPAHEVPLREKLASLEDCLAWPAPAQTVHENRPNLLCTLSPKYCASSMTGWGGSFKLCSSLEKPESQSQCHQVTIRKEDCFSSSESSCPDSVSKDLDKQNKSSVEPLALVNTRNKFEDDDVKDTLNYSRRRHAESHDGMSEHETLRRFFPNRTEMVAGRSTVPSALGYVQSLVMNADMRPFIEEKVMSSDDSKCPSFHGLPALKPFQHQHFYSPKGRIFNSDQIIERMPLTSTLFPAQYNMISEATTHSTAPTTCIPNITSSQTAHEDLEKAVKFSQKVSNHGLENHDGPGSPSPLNLVTNLSLREQSRFLSVQRNSSSQHTQLKVTKTQGTCHLSHKICNSPQTLERAMAMGFCKKEQDAGNHLAVGSDLEEETKVIEHESAANESSNSHHADRCTMKYRVSESNCEKLSISKNGVKVTLLNSALWESFHAVGTEMIINRGGRRMFPYLALSVDGLSPQLAYTVTLQILPVGRRRFKYINDRWVPVGLADTEPVQMHYIHPDSPSAGSHWQRSKIIFSKLKLTNNRDYADGNILLHSMHKYRMVTTFRPHGYQTGQNDVEELSFCFPETEFIAVTAYQNEAVTQMKIHNNPFAKAFRDSTFTGTRRHSSVRCKRGVPMGTGVSSPQTGDAKQLRGKRASLQATHTLTTPQGQMIGPGLVSGTEFWPLLQSDTENSGAGIPSVSYILPWVGLHPSFLGPVGLPPSLGQWGQACMGVRGQLDSPIGTGSSGNSNQEDGV